MTCRISLQGVKPGSIVVTVVGVFKFSTEEHRNRHLGFSLPFAPVLRTCHSVFRDLAQRNNQ